VARDQSRRLKKSDVPELLRIAGDVSRLLGWNPDPKNCRGNWNRWLFDTIGQLHPKDPTLIEAISSLNTLLV